MEREKPRPDYSITIRFSRVVKSALEAISKLNQQQVDVYFHLQHDEYIIIVIKHKTFRTTNIIKIKNVENDDSQDYIQSSKYIIRIDHEKLDSLVRLFYVDYNITINYYSSESQLVFKQKIIADITKKLSLKFDQLFYQESEANYPNVPSINDFLIYIISKDGSFDIRLYLDNFFSYNKPETLAFVVEKQQYPLCLEYKDKDLNKEVYFNKECGFQINKEVTQQRKFTYSYKSLTYSTSLLLREIECQFGIFGEGILYIKSEGGDCIIESFVPMCMDFDDF